MKVSNCCGVQPKSYPDGPDTEDLSICPECGEHCVYEEEDNEIRDMMQQIHKNYPNLDYVNPEYRKYYGQIKKDFGETDDLPEGLFTSND